MFEPASALPAVRAKAVAVVSTARSENSLMGRERCRRARGPSTFAQDDKVRGIPED
jgi:hypothetical protein